MPSIQFCTYWHEGLKCVLFRQKNKIASGEKGGMLDRDRQRQAETDRERRMKEREKRKVNERKQIETHNERQTDRQTDRQIVFVKRETHRETLTKRERGCVCFLNVTPAPPHPSPFTPHPNPTQPDPLTPTSPSYLPPPPNVKGISPLHLWLARLLFFFFFFSFSF